ncbi:ABC transporter permease [Pontibacter beigongshangensis]|uniref:ABC transporter permease n=1 Tax=Pontibacter beigongshangensis TaxID=2574733 RepID=UPI00164FF161|nr:ABC transporter permease [Pontibacter beigongshangensis]
MLKTYFLTAIRSLLRNRSYTFLNILGLALGITCSILLFLVIKFELSYDNFHENRALTYRVVLRYSVEGNEGLQAYMPVPVTELLRQNNPGLSLVTQIYGEEEGQITVPEQGNVPARHYREHRAMGFVEPEFFSMFDFDTGSGNFLERLREPNTMVLTRTLAEKYFPNEEAVGQTLRLNNKLTLQVVGVVPDLPVNTDFPFCLFISYSTAKDLSPYDISNWGITVSNQNLYVTLPAGADPAEMEARVNEAIMPHVPEKHDDIKAFFLQPLSDLHHNPDLFNYSMRVVPMEVIWAMGLIGVLLIVAACINFVNLATAQAIKRSKEVGMRKVLGGSFSQIMLQFLGETFLITLAATLVSIILAELALPFLNQLLELDLVFSFSEEPLLLLFLLLETVLVTLFAGLYPAFILAGYQPIAALKSRVNTQQVAGLSLRRALVVLQFTICQVLIICTLVVSEQMNYFRNKPLGFNREAIVLLHLPVGTAGKLMAYKTELTSVPSVKRVSFTLSPPASIITAENAFRLNGSAEYVPFRSHTKFADGNYFELFGISFAAGRNYAESDTIREFVINETMRRKLDFKTPEEALGHKLNMGGKEGPIVGVVHDFHQSSLHYTIQPSIITSVRDSYYHLAAKIDMSQTEAAIRHLEKVWNKAYPDDEFNYEFYEETFARFYLEETRQQTLFKVFAFIAILIGCLGLYGLISFLAAQRTKEVGVRKVLGASVFDIVMLFSQEFVKLVLIAFLIAAPIAYYLMHKWLEDFAYRIEISYGAFLVAGIATLLLALITMSAKAIQAALANPVQSLKTE